MSKLNAARDRTYWIYVDQDYDPNVSHGIVVWLHPVGKSKEKDIDDFMDPWISYCRDNHIIVAGPITVSGPDPRSIVELAPISTSSPMMTRPS